MCVSAAARSNKLYIVVTIDYLVGVQRYAIVRCADFLYVMELRAKWMLYYDVPETRKNTKNCHCQFVANFPSYISAEY